MEKERFKKLTEFLERVPAIEKGIGSGVFENCLWWVKFKIEIKNPLAWQVVQELGHVINYVSLNERLPTVFYPVSPPPYMNGGPDEFLSWVIESETSDFSPDDLQEWLEGRMPKPVDDLERWESEEEEE